MTISQVIFRQIFKLVTGYSIRQCLGVYFAPISQQVNCNCRMFCTRWIYPGLCSAYFYCIILCDGIDNVIRIIFIIAGSIPIYCFFFHRICIFMTISQVIFRQIAKAIAGHSIRQCCGIYFFSISQQINRNCRMFCTCWIYPGLCSAYFYCIILCDGIDNVIRIIFIIAGSIPIYCFFFHRICIFMTISQVIFRQIAKAIAGHSIRQCCGIYFFSISQQINRNCRMFCTCWIYPCLTSAYTGFTNIRISYG